MNVRIVDSLPPLVPVLVKTLATFPIRAPFSQRPAVWSKKMFPAGGES